MIERVRKLAGLKAFRNFSKKVSSFSNFEQFSPLDTVIFLLHYCALNLIKNFWKIHLKRLKFIDEPL